MMIGENIKRLRERFGLTQTQLGEIAGVSDKAVSTWEKGANVPRMGAIQRMADHFGIPKSEIIEGNDTNKKPIPLDELKQDVFNLLVELPNEDLVRVRDFLSGLRAAHAGEATRRK